MMVTLYQPLSENVPCQPVTVPEVQRTSNSAIRSLRRKAVHGVLLACPGRFAPRRAVTVSTAPLHQSQQSHQGGQRKSQAPGDISH